MTARTSSISTFSAIARENFEQLKLNEIQTQKLRSKIAKTKSDDNILGLEFKLSNLREKTSRCAAITIIFSAIAIEAHIYDYAARHFSDSFVKDYLDKLDPVSKWVIIPRLVTGKELPRKHKWFNLLKNLIKERNSIIHSKSSEPPSSPTPEKIKDYLRKLNDSEPNTVNIAKQSIQLLDLLIREISKIDPEETPWIKGHLSSGTSNLSEAK